MARTRKRVWVAQVLGGLALALLVLGVTIGSVQGITICDQCKNSAWSWATVNTQAKGGCSDVPGQWKIACLNDYVKRRCIDTGICPNINPASTVTCTGSIPPCPNGSVGICNNETYGQNCDASNPSKVCYDTQVLPKQGDPIYASVCYVTCTCK